MMLNILNLTLPELTELMVVDLGEPKFRAKQVWQWLWSHGARSFDEMSDVSKTARAALTERAAIIWPELVEEQHSADGTIKFLLRLEDGALIETVLIPGSKGRLTQCLSCQVGCVMGCTFCSTGQLGFTRNMTMAEILGQVLLARRYLGDERIMDPRLKNLVFMGMGEPLLNLREVMRSLQNLSEAQGLNFSPRRITVSTCGIEPGLKELGQSGLAYLAVSLHAPNQALRERIMPKAARWPLEDMLAVLEKYPLKTRERLTFEYLLLGGVNDSLEHAKGLARIMGRLKAKLNLIVYNPVEGMPYKAPDPDTVLAFEQYLWSKKVTAILRQSKGADIKAACGQLAAGKERKSIEGENP